MYSCKVINRNIPEKVFNQCCFYAVSEARDRLGDSRYIPAEIKNGMFCCNGKSNEILEVITNAKNSFTSRKYQDGIDFTINILIEN